MKKRFNLTDLDCASCAAKMEQAIKKLPGVRDAIVQEVVKVCKKVEPDCVIHV